MAKQIYIDENGNEQLVSGTINTADMLPIESGSSTNTKEFIETGLSGKAENETVTFTANNDVTLNSVSANKVGKNVNLTVSCTPTSATQNTWKQLGYVDKLPSAKVMTCAVREGNGSFTGMIEIDSSTGLIRLYAIQTLSNNAISFSIAYATA